MLWAVRMKWPTSHGANVLWGECPAVPTACGSDARRWPTHAGSGLQRCGCCAAPSRMKTVCAISFERAIDDGIMGYKRGSMSARVFACILSSILAVGFVPPEAIAEAVSETSYGRFPAIESSDVNDEDPASGNDEASPSSAADGQSVDLTGDGNLPDGSGSAGSDRRGRRSQLGGERQQRPSQRS